MRVFFSRVNRLVDGLKWLPFVLQCVCVCVWWYKNRFVCLTLTKCVHSNLHEISMLTHTHTERQRERPRESSSKGLIAFSKQIISTWVNVISTAKTTNCSICSRQTSSNFFRAHAVRAYYQMVDVFFFLFSLWLWLTRTIQIRCNRKMKEWNYVQIQ